VVRITTFKHAHVKGDTSFSDNGFPDMFSESCIKGTDELNDLWLTMY
jgi:hypothetical protein